MREIGVIIVGEGIHIIVIGVVIVIIVIVGSIVI